MRQLNAIVAGGLTSVLPSGGRRPAGTCDVEAGNDQSPLHVGAYPIGCGGPGILQESRVEKDGKGKGCLRNASTAPVQMNLKMF